MIMKKIAFLAVFFALISQGHAGAFGRPYCGWDSCEVGADWLYWKAFQDDLEYGEHVTIVTGATTTRDTSEIMPEFNPNSGYRIFVENGFFEQWCLSGIYTHISSKAGNSLNLDPANIASDFINLNTSNFPALAALTGAAFSSLDANWSSDFSYFDLDLSRPIYLSACFGIKPHLGFRALWRKQKLDLDGVAPGAGILTSAFTEKYDGCGVEGGLSAHLQLGWGLSLSGHLGGSLLYARIKVKENFQVLSDGQITLLSVGNTIFHLTPMMDAFLGLQYEGHLCSYPINFHAGWEQHTIHNATHLNLLRYSDFTLQGLTLGGSIIF